MSDGLKLLGAIIDTGSAHTIRDLSRELFIDDEVALYDMIRLHYRRYGQIPAISTVEEELGVAMPDAPETVDYYIRRVNDRRLYSLVRDQFNELKESLRSYNMDEAKEIIDAMRAATRAVHTSTDIRTFSEAAADVLRGYEYAHENPGISGVAVGWPYYDYITGGYQPGDLAVIVARPEMGKTYNLLRQATGAWRLGASVLVVTMEMTIEQITLRAAAMQAGINPTYIRKGTLSVYAERRLRSYIDSISGAHRFRMFSGGLKKKVSDVEMLVQEYDPDIVFIDGLYMMHPEVKKTLSKPEKINEVLDELKRLALGQNKPVVGTTQFNRTAGKKGKDGSLENIAYSDAISTHSSLIISLGQGKPPNVDTQRVMTFIKGREGESGEFTLNYTFAPMNHDEVHRTLPGDEEVEGEGATAETTTGGATNMDWMG